MDHIGIDVHKRESQVCMLADGGELIECRIRTEPQRFAAVLGPRERARILIEASTDSEWVARCVERLGHEVIVADPSFAPMYATRTSKVKTDRRDARALAEACLLGAYRPAHRLSDPQRQVRGRLVVRDALVRTRTRYISLSRALLRQHGYRIPSGSAEGFLARVGALALPGHLRPLIAPLLAVMRHLNRQLAYSDEVIDHISTGDARVQRLRTVPQYRAGHRSRLRRRDRRCRAVPPRAPTRGLSRVGARASTARAAHAGRGVDPAPAATRGRNPLDLGPAHCCPPG